MVRGSENDHEQHLSMFAIEWNHCVVVLQDFDLNFQGHKLEKLITDMVKAIAKMRYKTFADVDIRYR